MRQVMTVTGAIEPGELGVTYAHEHLFGGPPDWSPEAADADFVMLSPQIASRELGLFKLAGGHSIVEMSPADYNRRPEGLRDLSIEAGVHIIMTTGLHKDSFSHRITAAHTVEELAAMFTRDVAQGADDTSVRAGVIKAATSLDMITQGEDKVLRAAARAHLATRAPISTHTQNGTMGLEQIAVFREEGVNPSRVALGHVDRKLEYDYHRALLDTGANLIYDQISKEKYVADRDRVALLVRLVSEGYGKQLMLAGDFGRLSYWTSAGGGPGLTYILWRFVPWLVSEGMKPEDARAMLVDNPARFFAFDL
ncbi:MAG: phosphotriesterase-related protein [Chloroflexota bacterium]